MKIHFKRKKTAKKSRHFPFGKDPYFDWKFLIFLSVSFLILIFISGTYIFLGVYKGDLFVPPPKGEATKKTLDRTFIAELLAEFQRKEQNLNELRQGEIAIPDPSMPSH